MIFWILQCGAFARFYLNTYYIPFIFSTEGVRAKVYFKAIPTEEQNGLTFMRVDETKMDFSVKSIQMGVDNVAGGNPVIREWRDLLRIHFRFLELYFFTIHRQRLH